MDMCDKIWCFGFSMSGPFFHMNISKYESVYVRFEVFAAVFFGLALLSAIDQWIMLANTDFPFI